MTKSIIYQDQIGQLIFRVRGQNVMLDSDLANLYGTQTKILLQSVKRNIERFPEDFMFQMNKEELEKWRSQIVTSNPSLKMGLRRMPYLFTEQGVAMLSSVLRSPKAVQINIEIMRIFTKIRQVINSAKILDDRMDIIEEKYDAQFKIIFDSIKNILSGKDKKKKGTIGFHRVWQDED